MTTAKKTADKPKSVKMERIPIQTLKLQLVSTSPLLQHKLNDITDRTKLSDDESFLRCLYHTYHSTDAKPVYGLPASAFNRAIESARRFYKGAGKLAGDAFWKGAIRIVADPAGMVPFATFTPPVINVGQGRNQTGSVVRTVRAFFEKWEATLVVQFNEAILSPEIIVNQIEHAGFHVGVGAYRPEKGGTYGTFSVKVG